MNEIENYKYRIEEMRDAMVASLDNINEVIAQSEKLHKLVSDNDEEGYFDDFNKEGEKKVEDLKEQAKQVQERLGYVEALLAKCDEEATIEALFYISRALGIFKN